MYYFAILVMLQMMIGNADYQCSCVRYLPQDSTPLIVYLLVGLVLLLFLIIIILIIVIIIICRRRRRTKLAGQGQVSGAQNEMSMEQEQEDSYYYSRRLPRINDDDL